MRPAHLQPRYFPLPLWFRRDVELLQTKLAQGEIDERAFNEEIAALNRDLQDRSRER